MIECIKHYERDSGPNWYTYKCRFDNGRVFVCNEASLEACRFLRDAYIEKEMDALDPAVPLDVFWEMVKGYEQLGDVV